MAVPDSWVSYRIQTLPWRRPSSRPASRWLVSRSLHRMKWQLFPQKMIAPWIPALRWSSMYWATEKMFECIPSTTRTLFRPGITTLPRTSRS